MATNVSAIYLVGPTGNAFEVGAPLLLMVWSGNMLAAIATVTFLPRFRRLGRPLLNCYNAAMGARFLSAS